HKGWRQGNDPLQALARQFVIVQFPDALALIEVGCCDDTDLSWPPSGVSEGDQDMPPALVLALGQQFRVLFVADEARIAPAPSLRPVNALDGVAGDVPLLLRPVEGADDDVD